MFKKLSIKGLRGFAREGILKPAMPNGAHGSGRTVITGPNNSGKSTIIEAFKFLGSVHRDPSFHVDLRNVNSDSVTIIATTTDGQFTIKSLRPGSSSTIYDPKCSTLPYVIPSRRYFSPYFGRGSVGPREDFIRDHSSHAEVREQTLSRFESRLFRVEMDKEKFDPVLKRVIPDFLDWSIDQDEHSQYFIKLISKTGTHSFHGVGDGIISLFVIVAALYDPPIGDVIVIDEPELSLHPRLQRNLSELIDEYASERQIIISTHSPYFVSHAALQSGGQIIRVWERENSIVVYQLSIESCPALSRLITTNSNNPHLFGLDAKEVFFEDDPLVLLEGQEDVVFWPQVDPENLVGRSSIFGWGSGGAANMKNVCAVVEALGHRKVVGILDNNRPADLQQLRKQFPNYRFFELPAPDIRSKRRREARDAVEGLLDGQGSVRAHLALGLDGLLREIRRFLDAG